MSVKANKEDHLEFGNFATIYNEPTTSKKCCYFAGHSLFPDFPSYVFQYLERIREAGYDIIFISSSHVSAASLAKLKTYCSRIIEKANKGTDFGAWKVALTETNYGRDFDSVILANDSVFGPFRSIATDIQDFSSNFDLWGYSSSLEINYHIQSYFLCCNKKLLTSNFWVEFWKGVRLLSRKEDMIVNFEIGLTQGALANKFKVGAFADAIQLNKLLRLPSDKLNYTIAAWKELIIKFNFPLFKRELIVKDLAQSTNGGWASVISTVFSPKEIEPIEEYLTSFRKFHLDKQDVSYRISEKDIVLLSHYKSKLSKNQILAINLASQISRSVGRTFLTYQLNKTDMNAFDGIDDVAGIKYLGSIDSDLFEQYIYFWNKHNVQAIIVDYETFRLFKTYFHSFYSGNVLVVNFSNNELQVDYFVRTTHVSTSTTQLRSADLLHFEHTLRVKSDEVFLDTPEFLQIKESASAKNLSITWEDSQNSFAGMEDIVVEKLTTSGNLHTASSPEIRVEYDNYALSLIVDQEVVYFSDDINNFCLNLEQKLTEFSYAESEIRKAISVPFFDFTSLKEVYELCFSRPESNLILSPSTASFTHIYYEDTLYDLLPYLYNLSYLRNHTYFFSISVETINKTEIASKIRSVFPEAHIQIVKNSGKDIGGKLILMKLYLELGLQADFLILLHDKKSLHSWTIEGEQWRNELFKIAEPQYIFEVFSLFEENQKLGIIGNRKWLNNTDYDYNQSKFAFHDSFFRRKLDEYGIDINNYQFVGGTMFWMRDEILRAFYAKYSLTKILDNLEQGNILDSKEGTETHFLERFFGWFATSEKFELSGV